MHTLAVRLDNEGDVLLAGPAIRALAADSDRLTLLCGPRGKQAAALLPGVDEVRCHRAPWIDPEPGPVDWDDTMGLVTEIRALGCDRAVIFTSFHQSPLPTALLLRLAGVGFVTAVSEDYPGSLLDVRHRLSDDIHEVERGLSLAEAAGASLPDGDDGRLAIRQGIDGVSTRPAPPEGRNGSPESREGGFVVVHPGASVPARAWAPENHRALVGELARRGHTVAVTGSPDETCLTARVAGEEAIDLGGATDLAGLAEVLAGADAVVVGNTGPAHLAAAVGAPVVSLFAPTVPAVRWRPWGVPHELLHVEVACAGCRARHCPVPGHPCLDGLTVADVADAVERLAEAVSAGEGVSQR